MKTCYYYQTFIGLKEILKDPSCTDVIIISSLHFNSKKIRTIDSYDDYSDEIIYDIYLNDNKPDDKIFNDLWKETKILKEKGIKIMLMMGGAGGGYNNFFKDFNNNYPKLIKLLKSKPWITGIDLDIEEIVDIKNVKLLIESIKRTLGEDFTITMAPICSSLINDVPGMGGFSYKQLYKTHGKYIEWFNTQCYGGSFSYNTYNSIINNDYPENKIVMGMMSGDFSKDTFKDALNEVNKIKIQYKNFGGVFDWEYLDAPPNLNDPSIWAKSFKNIENNINSILVIEEKALLTMYKYIEINDITPSRFKNIYLDMINSGYSFIKIDEYKKKNLLIELRLLLKDKYPLTNIELHDIKTYMLDDNSLKRSNSFENLLNTWELIVDSDDD